MSVLEEYLLNSIKKFTLIVIVQGQIQSGKSTLVYWLCQQLHRAKYKEEWNYKKYCARSLKEFIHILDNNNGKFLVYEESTSELNVQRHYSDKNLFFNVIMQTQGYKHNIIFLVFPHSKAISKQQRYFINLGIEILFKVDQPLLKGVVFKTTVYKRSFYKLDDDDIYYRYWCTAQTLTYNKQELKDAMQYTKWLEGSLKKDVMKRILKQIDKLDLSQSERIKADIKENIKENKENLKKITANKPVKALKNDNYY